MDATDINPLFAELEAVPMALCLTCGAPFPGSGEDGDGSCTDCEGRPVFPA